MPIRILVTGGNGQLASCIRQVNSYHKEFEIIFADKSQLDISDFDSCTIFFQQSKFDIVINTAAYTAVDLAESNQEIAWNINVIGTKNLAQICSVYDLPLIHISSDYVYDNEMTTPMPESSICTPKSIYALTKWESEQVAIFYNPQTIIIRTSWVYSEYGENFVKTILRLSHEKKQIQVVNDQIGAPSYAIDLATLLLEIAAYIFRQNPTKIYGIYNFANAGMISWYDFAKEILKLSGSDCKVSPTSTSSFPRPAPRPKYSVFDLKKIEATFGIKPKHWENSLAICVGNILAVNR